MLETIGSVCIMLERGKYFASYKVLKDRRHENWLKDLKKVADLRGQNLVFKRGEGLQNDKGSLRRTKINQQLECIYVR